MSSPRFWKWLEEEQDSKDWRATAADLLHPFQSSFREEPMFLSQGHSVGFVMAHQKEEEAPLLDIAPQS